MKGRPSSDWRVGTVTRFRGRTLDPLGLASTWAVRLLSGFVVALMTSLQVWAQPAPAPVGSEFQINVYTTGNQESAAVAAAADGDFVVVWQSFGQDGSSDGVFGRRFSSVGAPVGPEFQVNTLTTDAQRHPAVAAESSGGFVVAWQSFGSDGAADGISGQRYSSAGTPLGTEFQVNTYATGYQTYPAVAADAGGDFVVVWQSGGQDGSSDGVFGRRYDSAGAAVGSAFQVNTYTTSGQRYPDVGADADGAFVVVWQSAGQDHSLNGIFGQRYSSAGAPLGTEFQVNSYSTSGQYLPAVGVDAEGAFAVVWQSNGQDGSLAGVFGQRFDSAGARVGTEFQVNTYTTNFQGNPDVSMDADGDFVVVWQSSGQDGSSIGVFGQRYDSTGNPFGTEFRVNTYTAGFQGTYGVASDAGGDFVVVWNSVSQDGTSGGIFGQRYDVPGDCPPAPLANCQDGWAVGSLLVKDEVSGKEKLVAKFLKGPQLAQADFGNPLSPAGTVYRLCIYADGTPAGELKVDRAGDADCGSGADVCWKSIGPVPPAGKGYKYKDTVATASGIAKIMLKGGAVGQSKVLVVGKGPLLQLGIPAALTNATSVTIQVFGDPAPQCFSATLTDVKKHESGFFKANK